MTIQLEALRRNDVYRAFKFASPANKAATGPWQRFKSMIQSSPDYRQLLCMASYEIVGALPVGETQKRVLVRVRPAGSSSAPFAVADVSLGFSWELSLQAEPDTPFTGCWMVDGVVPVNLRPQ